MLCKVTFSYVGNIKPYHKLHMFISKILYSYISIDSKLKLRILYYFVRRILQLFNNDNNRGNVIKDFWETIL